MTKIYKPNNCTECKVYKKEKGKIGICLCMVSSRRLFDTLEEMHNNCPLNWDK